LELALNVVWAAISVALLYLAWRPWVCVAKAQRRYAGGVLAALCLICVLFPAISLSDDLHATPAILEASRSKTSIQDNDPGAHLTLVAVVPMAVQIPAFAMIWATLSVPAALSTFFDSRFQANLFRRPPPASVR